MALKQPIKTTTNTAVQASPHAVQLHLPAPQTFDILPPLHELLARVDAHYNQGLPPPEAVLEDGNGDIGAAYAEIQPLDPKAFSESVLDIKARIRKAQKVLEQLPDMDRSISAQDEEIRELEIRIQQQREMLQRLGTTAESLKKTRLG